MTEASPAHKLGFGKRNHRQPGGQDREREVLKREELFAKRFCMAPCACCGAKNHPMLSPIKSPEGAPVDCDYICPTVICSNWQEQRMQRNPLRFQPCPRKFAAMCHNDTAMANTAFSEYECIGSGRYRNPRERNTFRRDVLMNCKAPLGSSNYPRRTMDKDSPFNHCQSSSAWLVDEDRNIEDNLPLLPYGTNTDGEVKKCTGGQHRNKYESPREKLFAKRFCMAPCACCGAKNHPMLSPIKNPEGDPLDCDYVCPTAICSNWQEQRRHRNALRFQPCPKKFAARCHNDTATANTALDRNERIGSGQYRNPQERGAFRRNVLKNCKAPSGSSNYPRRSIGRGSPVEQCYTTSIWSVDEDRNKPPLLPYGKVLFWKIKGI